MDKINCIGLKIAKHSSDVPLGKSKLFGAPDVFEGFEWPYIDCGDGPEDLDFLCQISLADVAPYDAGNELPHKGMLYFFYAIDSCVESSDEQAAAAKVLFYGGDEELMQGDIIGEDGNIITPPAYAIDFEKRVGHAELGDDGYCQMLGFHPACSGEPGSESFYDIHGGQLKRLLLSLGEICRGDVSLYFNGGELCFLLDQTELEKGEFEKAEFLQMFD